MGQFSINKPLESLVHLFLRLLTKRYRITARIPEEIKGFEGNAILLSNHVGAYDPFIISHYIPFSAHFVTSDAVLKQPLLGFLLKKLGVIPKKKNQRDSQVIRHMLELIKSGESIGLFPEGCRTWSGKSLHIEPSIVKLVKLLNVPVIGARMKGMYLMHPRWSFRLRRAQMEIDYQIICSKAELQELSNDKIYSRIVKALFHDEMAYQRKHLIPIKSRSRAFGLDYVLFACPQCRAFDSLTPHKHHLTCEKCDTIYKVNEFGFFEIKENNNLPMDMTQWFDWEKQFLEECVKEYMLKASEKAFFVEKRITFIEEEEKTFRKKGDGEMRLFQDHIRIRLNNGVETTFDLDELKSLTAQHMEKIEFTTANKSFRVEGNDRVLSGVKWELALNAIWQLQGQKQKCSTYFK